MRDGRGTGSSPLWGVVRKLMQKLLAPGLVTVTAPKPRLSVEVQALRELHPRVQTRPVQPAAQDTPLEHGEMFCHLFFEAHQVSSV